MEVLSHKKSIEWKVATYRIGMKIPLYGLDYQYLKAAVFL